MICVAYSVLIVAGGEGRVRATVGKTDGVEGVNVGIVRVSARAADMDRRAQDEMPARRTVDSRLYLVRRIAILTSID
ncbi:MAG: hypothetical protein WAV05_06505 [Anaerolineales bacterium]